MFGWLAHRTEKKRIEKLTGVYRRASSDQLAACILGVWVVRGLLLTPGADAVGVRIFHYVRGAEVPLTDWEQGFLAQGDESMALAISHHLLTNHAVSYPDSGYGAPVRELWDALLSDTSALAATPLPLTPELQEIVDQADVSHQALIARPRAILPHFMVPGHPLSAELLERDKLARQMLGE
ncbi:hypothetical protein J2T57_001508 [Natronocella acetinitrilica]|uniref:Uncharacterized protein n=1 Tax=Natronocella acetinitrilica TaxID=414046 RepID=A0AAE3KB98_9GAMM|nr:hypothetical protein [Natronocella acetinitrilica]MCP1674406.1 hypothetical protein [Natronocella acetinitrilica]